MHQNRFKLLSCLVAFVAVLAPACSTPCVSMEKHGAAELEVLARHDKMLGVLAILHERKMLPEIAPEFSYEHLPEFLKAWHAQSTVLRMAAINAGAVPDGAAGSAPAIGGAR